MSEKKEVVKLKDSDLEKVSGGFAANSYTLNYGDTFSMNFCGYKRYLIYVGNSGATFNLDDKVMDLIDYYNDANGYKKSTFDLISNSPSMRALANNHYEGVHSVEELDAMLLIK